MKIRRFLTALAVAAAAACFTAAFAACSGFQADVESVSLSAESLTLAVGETAQLTATVNAEGGAYTVTWSTSAEEVATVSESGLVTAEAEGSAIVTAAAGGKSASCAVTVTAASDGGEENGGEEDGNGGEEDGSGETGSYLEILKNALSATEGAENFHFETSELDYYYCYERVAIDYVCDPENGVFCVGVTTSSEGAFSNSIWEAESESKYYVLEEYVSGSDVYYIVYEYDYSGAWVKTADNTAVYASAAEAAASLAALASSYAEYDLLSALGEILEELSEGDIAYENGVYGFSCEIEGQAAEVKAAVSGGMLASVTVTAQNGAGVYSFAYPAEALPSFLGVIDGTDYASALLGHCSEGYLDIEGWYFDRSDHYIVISEETDTAELLTGASYDVYLADGDGYTYAATKTISEETAVVDTSMLTPTAGTYYVKVTDIESGIWEYVAVYVDRNESIYMVSPTHYYAVGEAETLTGTILYIDGRRETDADITPYVTAIYRKAASSDKYGERVELAEMLSTEGIYIVYCANTYDISSSTVYVYDEDEPMAVDFRIGLFNEMIEIGGDAALFGYIGYADGSSDYFTMSYWEEDSDFYLTDLIEAGYILSAYRIDSYQYYTGTAVADYSSIPDTAGIYYITYGNSYYSGTFCTFWLFVYDDENPEVYGFSSYINGDTYCTGYFADNYEGTMYVYGWTTDGNSDTVVLYDGASDSEYVISVEKLESESAASGTALASVGDIFQEAGVYRITYGNSYYTASAVVHVYDHGNPDVYSVYNLTGENAYGSYYETDYSGSLTVRVRYVDGSGANVALTADNEGELIESIYEVVDVNSNGWYYEYDLGDEIASLAEMFSRTGAYLIYFPNGGYYFVTVYDPEDVPVVEHVAGISTRYLEVDENGEILTAYTITWDLVYADGTEETVTVSAELMDLSALVYNADGWYDADGNRYAITVYGDAEHTYSTAFDVFLYQSENLTVRSITYYGGETLYYSLTDGTFDNLSGAYLSVRGSFASSSTIYSIPIYLTEDMLYIGNAEDGYASFSSEGAEGGPNTVAVFYGGEAVAEVTVFCYTEKTFGNMAVYELEEESYASCDAEVWVVLGSVYTYSYTDGSGNAYTAYEVDFWYDCTLADLLSDEFSEVLSGYSILYRAAEEGDAEEVESIDYTVNGYYTVTFTLLDEVVDELVLEGWELSGGEFSFTLTVDWN